MYNFSQIGADREWLQDVLLSDMESDLELSDEDEYVREMLRQHVKEKKIRDRYYRNPHVCDYVMISLNTRYKSTIFYYFPKSRYRIPNMVTMVQVSYQTPIYTTNTNVKSSVIQQKRRKKKSADRRNIVKQRKSTLQRPKRFLNRGKLIGMTMICR